jgi:hypothetical protein
MSLHLRSRTSFYDDNSICRKHSWWLVHTWWLSSAVPTMIEKPILGAGLKHFFWRASKLYQHFCQAYTVFYACQGLYCRGQTPGRGGHWNGKHLRRAMSLHLRSHTSLYDDDIIYWFQTKTFMMNCSYIMAQFSRANCYRKTIFEHRIHKKQFVWEGLKAWSKKSSSVHSFVIRVRDYIGREQSPGSEWHWNKVSEGQGVHFEVATSNQACQIYHSKVFKLAARDPYPYTGDPWAAWESPATTKGAARAWALGQAWARAWEPRPPLV